MDTGTGTSGASEMFSALRFAILALGAMTLASSAVLLWTYLLGAATLVSFLLLLRAAPGGWRLRLWSPEGLGLLMFMLSPWLSPILLAWETP